MKSKYMDTYKTYTKIQYKLGPQQITFTIPMKLPLSI